MHSCNTDSQLDCQQRRVDPTWKEQKLKGVYILKQPFFAGGLPLDACRGSWWDANGSPYKKGLDGDY